MFTHKFESDDELDEDDIISQFRELAIELEEQEDRDILLEIDEIGVANATIETGLAQAKSEIEAWMGHPIPRNYYGIYKGAEPLYFGTKRKKEKLQHMRKLIHKILHNG